MERGEPLGARVTHLEEVVQVGAAVVAAGRAVTPGLHRFAVDPISRVEDVDGAEECRAGFWQALRITRAKCVEPTMACVPGRQRAVEQRIAEPECADDVIGTTDSQRVLRGVLR